MADVVFITDDLWDKFKTDDENLMGWLSDFLDSYEQCGFEKKTFITKDLVYKELKGRGIENIDESIWDDYYIYDIYGMPVTTKLSGYCNLTEFIKIRITTKTAKDNLIEVLLRFVALDGFLIINNWLVSSRDEIDFYITQITGIK